VVTGTITKIAPFGAFARIEDGIEGLIHLSELPAGMDPKASLHEGQQLQLRILRIDAERRRLGLSLRQAEEMDKEPVTETSTDTGTSGATSDMMSLSLEAPPSQSEEGSAQPDKESSSQRRDTKGERRDRQERNNENPLLNNLPLSDEGETTAMAEAFRAAARQRPKEEAEDSLE